jgi:hypothetical protein
VALPQGVDEVLSGWHQAALRDGVDDEGRLDDWSLLMCPLRQFLLHNQLDLGMREVRGDDMRDPAAESIAVKV